ncbi:MAG: hypothetical protein AAB723_01385 [Patescibacteria group bacterium]
MINLLSPQDKKEFKKEIIFKKISMILFFHFIGLLILIFALALTSAFFAQQTKIIKEQAVQQEQQAQSAQFQAYKADAVSFNNTLNKLESFWQKQILTSDFLADFLPLLSPNTHLKALSFKVSAKKSAVEATTTSSMLGAIRVDGVVDSREGLYEFKKLLESQPEFQEIIFAPSSWAKAAFPDFSLNFNFLPVKK